VTSLPKLLWLVVMAIALAAIAFLLAAGGGGY
jgi:hypothetical protein